MRRGFFRPVGSDRVPEFPKALFVGVAVLDDQRIHTLWATHRNPESNWGDVVHQVQAVAAEFEEVDESLDDARDVVERVLELIEARH